MSSPKLCRCPTCDQLVPQGKETRVADVIQMISETTKISPQDIIGPSRFSPIVRARLAVYFLSRRMTRKSYPQIGRAIGNRDHSTIQAGVKRARKLIRSDPGFARLVARAEAPAGQGVLL